MPEVVFFTSHPPETVQLLTQHAPPGFNVQIYPLSMLDEEKIPLVQAADFLILFPGVISEPVLRAARKVKLIQLVSAGYDRMNLSLCRELGIPVANNGGTNAIDVAEHTIALILGFYRRLPELDQNVRTERWRAVDTGLCTYTIHGKKAGIIGMGNIGRRVAGLLQAFGAQVFYHDKFPLPPEREQALGITRKTLEGLLEVSDIVTLHVNLTPETRGLIGQAELARMKPTALLVNTCRGPVVDEKALIEALQAGQIRGAALDVLEQEPPAPDNPLLKLDNVLLTPHSAGVTYDTWPRRGQFIFENLQRVWAGHPPLAVIEPDH